MCPDRLTKLRPIVLDALEFARTPQEVAFVLRRDGVTRADARAVLRSLLGDGLVQVGPAGFHRLPA